MSESDAEWFVGVDTEFGARSSPGPFPPNSPRPPRHTSPGPVPTRPPRHTSPGPVPTRPPRPTTTRPTPRLPKPDSVDPHDASDKMPPRSPSQGLSNATIISVTLASCVVIVVLILILFYFVIVKKKLRKLSVPPRPARQKDDYSIRIEDVAHLNINETDAIYMNTTDIQKLVSTVRFKSMKYPPSSSGKSEENFPDVVRVTQPVVTIPVAYNPSPTLFPKSSQLYTKPANCSLNKPNISPPKIPVVTSPSIEHGVSNAVVARPAPPPPTMKKSVKPAKNNEKPAPPLLSKPSQDNLSSVHGLTSQIDSTISSQVQKPVIPVLPKPVISKGKVGLEGPEESSHPQNIFKPPPPNVASKPIFNIVLAEAQKPSPSTLKKPSTTTQGSIKKPILPPLKMNKVIKYSNLKPTGISSPDTASSYLADTSESETEPERMSVRAKRAFLEKAMTSERHFKRIL